MSIFQTGRSCLPGKCITISNIFFSSIIVKIGVGNITIIGVENENMKPSWNSGLGCMYSHHNNNLGKSINLSLLPNLQLRTITSLYKNFKMYAHVHYRQYITYHKMSRFIGSIWEYHVIVFGCIILQHLGSLCARVWVYQVAGLG